MTRCNKIPTPPACATALPPSPTYQFFRTLLCSYLPCFVGITVGIDTPNRGFSRKKAVCSQKGTCVPTSTPIVSPYVYAGQDVFRGPFRGFGDTVSCPLDSRVRHLGTLLGTPIRCRSRHHGCVLDTCRVGRVVKVGVFCCPQKSRPQKCQKRGLTCGNIRGRPCPQNSAHAGHMGTNADIWGHTWQVFR